MLIFRKLFGMGDFALHFCIEWETLKSFQTLPFLLLATNLAENVFLFGFFLCFWSCLLPIFMMDGVVPEQQEEETKKQADAN